MIIIDTLFNGKKINSLTKEETKKLLIELKNGSKDARDKIIAGSIKLVFNLALNKYKYLQVDKNELVSIGNIGLIKAVDSYDISKGYEFSTYATTCIDNEIKNFLAKSKRNIKSESLEDCIHVNAKKNNMYSILDTIQYDPMFVEDYEMKEFKVILNILIEELDEIDKKIIKMYYGIGCKRRTQVEIANMLGIKRTTLTMRIKTILKKLKRKINTTYIYDDSSENIKIKIK